MPKLFDLVKFNTATTNTGSITIGAAVSGFNTPMQVGAVDGDTVRYLIRDGLDYELGVGTLFSSVAQMARTTVTRSFIGGTVGTTKLNLSGTAVVALTAAGSDILNPADNLAGLASASTARANLGLGTASTLASSALAQLGAPNEFTDTTEATGAGSTFAAKFAGGVEILKKLFVSGIARFTSAIPSTSTTTGGVVVDGGLGVGGAVNAGGSLSGANFKSTSTVGLDALWTVDATPYSASIPNGGNYLFAPGSGLVCVSNVSNGQTAVFICGVGTTVLVAQTGSDYAIAPGSGKVAFVYYSANAAYGINNQLGSTATLSIVALRSRPSS